MTKRLPVLLAVIALLTLTAAAQNPNSAGMGYGSNYIMDGTRFLVTLDDKLESKKLEQGKKFKAKLAEDLVAPNGESIPRGKKLKGHVSSVSRGLHGRLLLSFDQIETRHGWVPLVATVADIPGEKSMKVSGNEGELQKKGASKVRVLEGAAIGAAAGAGTGAVAGGAHGAIIGAAAGAAVGGTAGLLTDRDFKLDKGTTLELRLDRPLQVPSH